MTTADSKQASAVARRSVELPERVGARAALLALGTAALWGGNPVAVSFSVDTLPPIAVAAVRFAMAAVFMFFWCKVEGKGLWLAVGQRLPVVIAGVGLFVQITLFNIGTWLSNSSHSSMLINTFVFWVALLEHFVTRDDRLTRGKLLGLLVAMAGVMLILSSHNAASTSVTVDEPSLWGDVLLLLSAMVLGLKVIIVKRAVKVVEPGKLIFWHDLLAVGLFAACSLIFESTPVAGWTLAATLAILYQGVFVAGICFAVQAHLLRRYSASQIAVFSFATPIFGVLLAVLLRGDPWSPWLLVSTVCVAAGIWLVQRGPGRPGAQAAGKNR